VTQERSPSPSRRLLGRLIETTRLWIEHPPGLALLLLAVALVSRMAQFGNPVVGVDEQFYLLAGSRMLEGALPFVDIWDRKPVGLFLIYAAACLPGGDGVLGYQLLATLFAATTAFVIARTARPFAGAHGGAAAGVVYLLFLGALGGDGGQSPLFYNLPVALAGAAMLRIVARPGFGRRSAALGVAVTGLMGLAIQIKYSVVFEGAFFGLALIWKAWREGFRGMRLAAAALAWMAAGLAPTAAAWGWYAAMGHGDAFVFANFTSIFLRVSEAPWVLIKRLGWIAAILFPLAITALLARRVEPELERDRRRFVTAWLLAALAGLLVFGTWFDHYALPLLVPLTLAAAPLLGRPGAGIAVIAPGTSWRIPAAVALMLFGTVCTASIVDSNRARRGWGPQAEAIAAQLRGLPDCPFVHDGDVALYQLARACLSTRWPMPLHLKDSRETGAIGVDQVAETRRIMAARPSVVVSSPEPEVHVNRASWDLVHAELKRAYAPGFSRRIGNRDYIVYRRRPGM
jgi:hypothetical protein